MANQVPLHQHWENLVGPTLDVTKNWVYEAIKDAMNKGLQECDIALDHIPKEQMQPLIRWLQTEHRLKCCLKTLAGQDDHGNVVMLRSLYVHW